MKITIEGTLREGSCDDIVIGDGALLENAVRRAMQAVEKGCGKPAKATVIVEASALGEERS